MSTATLGALYAPGISMEELYKVCFILRVSKECNLPSLQAIGRGICEVVDGLNL